MLQVHCMCSVDSVCSRKCSGWWQLTDLGKDFKSVITIKKLFILPAQGKGRSFLEPQDIWLATRTCSHSCTSMALHVAGNFRNQFWQRANLWLSEHWSRRCRSQQEPAHPSAAVRHVCGPFFDSNYICTISGTLIKLFWPLPLLLVSYFNSSNCRLARISHKLPQCTFLR